jgi:hypothetical protein
VKNSLGTARRENAANAGEIIKMQTGRDDKQNSDSGEALNKRWHELEGWQLEHRHGWSNPIWIRRLSLEWAESAIDLPALHLDANLAIAAANRVFNKDWSIEIYPDKVAIYDGREECVAVGGNVCLGILKALIASKEKR